MTSSVAQIHRAPDALAELTEQLIREYHAEFAPGFVIRCVARSVYDLRATGATNDTLAAEVEPLVRLELEDLRAGESA